MAQKTPPSVPLCAKSEQKTNAGTRFLPNELQPPPPGSTAQPFNGSTIFSGHKPKKYLSPIVPTT
jgi:hypothetical protein